MKSPSNRFVPIVGLTAGLATLAFTGCSKEERADAKTTAKDAYADTKAAAKDAYADTKAAVSNAWDSVKSYSFEKREDFSAHVKAQTSKLDAQLAEARADYSDAKASASRKAAMEELKNSEADYKAKVEALGSATAATWDSAKQNVIASWDHVQAAYHKARAD